MKRKDDDLLRLAFRELSDDDARAIESRADADDRRELEALRSLREGLQHLPPPPPDGLSAERLRAAILDGELKARRAPFAWGPWLFAPVALAALAAVVVLPRLRHRPEVEIVSAPTSTLAMKVPALGFPPLSSSVPSKPIVVVAKVPAARVAENEVVVRHRRRHWNAAPVVGLAEEAAPKQPLALAKTPDDPKTLMALAVRPPEPETIAAPPSTVVEAEPGVEGRTETVVMVSGKRDLETGAPAATEKEATSVLVGG